CFVTGGSAISAISDTPTRGTWFICSTPYGGPSDSTKLIIHTFVYVVNMRCYVFRRYLAGEVRLSALPSWWAARHRTASERSESARKASRTKGPVKRRQAAGKGARARAARSGKSWGGAGRRVRLDRPAAPADLAGRHLVGQPLDAVGRNICRGNKQQ